MPRAAMISTDPPAAVAEALSRLGRNIRTARLRRQMTQDSLADRLGASRYLVADLEQGKPTTGIAAYLGALWVLGLLDQVASVGDPALDEEGILLQRSREPRRARSRTADDDF
ncbi:MAG: XRE family transcriptional regulator [Gammaproteobacteria bacterium]|nr:XRE family transcriptional regulator [Gammaproteobacteria bacterium]